MRCMKIFIALLFLGFSFFQAAAFAAYTCSKGCESQCKVGFLGNNVDPVCFSGCKAWQLAKCYDISDPWVSGMGEAGQSAYVGAASTMQTRNPIWKVLDKHEKNILRPFYGDLVDRIRLHLKSNLMDRWGSDPYQIRLGSSLGQTYGHDVYIRFYRTELDRVDRIILLGHELCHSRQYEARGSSLHRFGRDYFEGFARAGGYASNPMEKECEALENKFEAAAQKYWKYFDENKRPWNFDVCNESDYDTLFVAIGWPDKPTGGFSLVPMRVSKGWFPVPKGECKRILSNAQSGEAIDAYATAAAQGNWATWSSPSGPAYCVHPTNAFDIGNHSHCANGQEKVNFKMIDNPWRAFGSGTYKWRLTGKAAKLLVCNQSGKALDASVLRGDRGEWRSEGWYPFNNGQCREWNFGAYTGKIFIHGANFSTGTVWQDPSKPRFCVYPGMVFEHDQDTRCFTSKGGVQVSGFEVDLKAGMTTWNFRP